MADLYELCPNLFRRKCKEQKSFEPLIDTMAENNILTCDLLCLEPTEIARRTNRGILDVQALIRGVSQELADLHVQKDESTENGSPPTKRARHSLDATTAGGLSSHLISSLSNLQQDWITLGSTRLDNILGGKGIPTGVITEFCGQSASGKSHFLMDLTVNIQLPLKFGGLSSQAVYISTEKPLETRRLSIMAKICQQKSTNVSLDNIHTISCRDLEELNHILLYQLPVLVEKTGARIIVIDSIAYHFRAESGDLTSYAKNSYLSRFGRILQTYATRYNLAVAVSNQISDVIVSETPDKSQQTLSSSLALQSQSQSQSLSAIPDIFDDQSLGTLSLDEQIGYTSGWGYQSDAPHNDEPIQDKKRPTLGVVWTNFVAQRIVLKKYYHPEDLDFVQRSFQLVFSPWAPPAICDFTINDTGIAAI